MTDKTAEAKKTGRLSNTWQSIIVLVVLAGLFAFGAVSFLGMRHYEKVPKGPGVTRTGMLSDYFAPLKGTACDTEVFYLEGANPGKTVVILGGTHPNEPSGMLAATLIVETAKVESGKLIVIPHTNASAFSYSTPGEAQPIKFTIKTDWGEQSYRYGSRLANPLHQFPDPDVYVHYPSGQLMAGSDWRNLDRAYPGNPNGGLVEKLAYAITQMVIKEDAAMTVDLHEARPMNPIVNCIITPERALDLSTLAQMDLEEITKDPWHLEPSPKKMYGMSHRGLTDATNTLAVLTETGNPAMDYPRGPTTEKLVVDGVDDFYKFAAERHVLYVPYAKDGMPIRHRVARQLASTSELITVLGQIEDDGKPIVVNGIPSYDDVETNGLGHYIIRPQD